MKLVHGAALAAFLLIGGSAQAGEGIGDKAFYGGTPSCRFAENSTELLNYSSLRELRAEVKSRYERAAEVSKSNRAIFSASPLYEWASQAKNSCAKSYGSLRMSRKWKRQPDNVMLQKCECFYERMTTYLGQ